MRILDCLLGMSSRSRSATSAYDLNQSKYSSVPLMIMLLEFNFRCPGVRTHEPYRRSLPCKLCSEHHPEIVSLARSPIFFRPILCVLLRYHFRHDPFRGRASSVPPVSCGRTSGPKEKSRSSSGVNSLSMRASQIASQDPANSPSRRRGCLASTTQRRVHRRP